MNTTAPDAPAVSFAGLASAERSAARGGSRPKRAWAVPASSASLWIAAVAVFVALCPVQGLDGRIWQQTVLLLGGTAAAVIALAGASPLSAAVLWIVGVAAVSRSGPGYVLMLLAALGIFALARRHGAAPVLRVIVAVNVAVMALQVIGVWAWMLNAAVPGATFEVYNQYRPIVGLTYSTGDVSCVLAMALPFCAVGRWRIVLGLGVVALLFAQALSGIVAAVVGLLVVYWPKIKPQSKADTRIGEFAIGGFAMSVFLGQEELVRAWQDDRWRVWPLAARRWLETAPLFGNGAGSWFQLNATLDPTPTAESEIWSSLHFDLLQHGYETGLVGVLLVIVAWVWACRRAAQVGNRAALGGLAALAVCQFGHFPMHLASAGVVAMCVLGEAVRDEQ